MSEKNLSFSALQTARSEGESFQGGGASVLKDAHKLFVDMKTLLNLTRYYSFTGISLRA